MASTISDSATIRYAVVTGGNKGIGLEICRQLASNGVMVVLTARDEKRGLEAVAKLHESGLSNVIFHQLDVMDAISISSLAQFIATNYGKLDILVRNQRLLEGKFSSNGVMVVLTARDEKRGLEAMAKLHESGLSNIIFHQLGVMDANSVNNAGVTGFTVDWEPYKILTSEDAKSSANLLELMITAMKQTYESAEECVKTNYYGTKGVTEALLPCLLRSNLGRIVNVSSVLGMLQFVSNERVRMELNEVDVFSVERLDEIVNEYLKDAKEEELHDKGRPIQTCAYTISNASKNAFTRIMAKSYPSLLINCICPGYIKTDMTANTGFFTVDVGARGPVMLALLPEGGPSGLFFQQMQASTF